MKKKNLKRTVLVTILLLAMVSLMAQGTPEKAQIVEEEFKFDKDITIVVPFNVGGALDARARVVAKYLEQEIGQSVIVRNPVGAGGVIGTTEFVNQKGGPYDLIFSGLTIITLTPLISQVPYSPDDIIPLISNDKELFGLFTNPKITGISTFEELMAYGKTKAIKFGSGAPGNITHMLQYALYKELGMLANNIPHGGANEGLTNALGGHVDVTLAGLPLAKGFVEEGLLMPIAVYNSDDYTKYSKVDSVPAIVNMGLGVDDFVYENLMFFGMRATADPKAVQAMYDAIAKVYQNPNCIEDLKKLGVDPIVSMNRQEIEDFIAAEIIFMKKLVSSTK